MNIFKTIYGRLFQTIMYLGAFFINFREPKIFNGKDSLELTIKIFKEKRINNIFIAVNKTVFNLGLVNSYLEKLKENNINFTLYLDIKDNPSIIDVENGLNLYLENKSQVIVSIGGGSVIDASKIIGARATNIKKSVRKMKGLFKINKKTPLFIAVPTTAGTGSEATLASVIVDEENGNKYQIDDPKLIPDYAILDPNFLLTLPGNITSTTGMDTLTHAIEAYIGRSNVKKTKRYALRAIKLVFNNLENSFNEPSNIKYRENMQLASYLAGVAFTRAYVGYVHALSHPISGKYNLPHGLTNAIILPYILKMYGNKIYKKMGEIYDYVQIHQGLKTNKEKCEYLISKIEEMNKNMNINNILKDVIKENDIPFLVNHAYKEAYPLYPVPIMLNKKEIKIVYKQLLKE